VVCAGAGLVSYLFNYGSTSACNCRTALKAMRARSSSPCLTCENSGRGAMPCCSSSYFRFIWPRGPMDKASAYGAGDCRFESCRGHCCRSDSDSPKILPPPMWTKFIMAQPKHHHVWILPSLPSKYAHALSHGLCGTARMDTLPEWSKGVDSSSTSASCVGSNPTGVIHDLGVDGRMEAHVDTTFLYSFLSFLLPFSVQCYYLCISFALPRSLSLSLSILLSLALSHYLSLFLLLLCPPSVTPATCFIHPHARQQASCTGACRASGTPVHPCSSKSDSIMMWSYWRLKFKRDHLYVDQRPITTTGHMV
jgi:hypothetical protein